MIAAIAIYALWAPEDDPVRETRAVVENRQAAGEAPEVSRDVVGGAISRLESQQSLLNAAALPLETRAGRLTVAAPADAPRVRAVLLDGEAVPGLRDDAITLAHRAIYSDREIIVGFTQCNGIEAPCGFGQPFWLELRPEAAPVVRRAAGVWASSGAGSVTAVAGDVKIDLGVWNGERRSATLTGTREVVVTRTREPIRPLAPSDCATVARAAEACATSRDCRSFASSARPIPRARWARLTRAYHESTGLNATAFRALCVQSCKFGFTPSYAFTQTYVCSGAPSGQWPSGDPAPGLVR